MTDPTPSIAAPPRRSFGDLLRRHRRSAAAVGGLLLALLAWIRLGPLPPVEEGATDHDSVRIVDRNGEPLHERPSAEGTRGGGIDPTRLPPRIVAATVAAEDRRFFLHPGVDPVAIARAAFRNLRSGRAAEGGSTLTQQLAKMLWRRPRTLSGKVREAILALRLEHRWSKREILARYLSLAPYGNQWVGIEAASRGYFGSSPEALTVAQAAFLAGLPQRPTTLDPYRNLEGALARQKEILDRMVRSGALSNEEAPQARGERIRIAPPERPFVAPHFALQILAGLPPGPRPSRVETTLDLPLQREIGGILSAARPELERIGARSVAVAVLDNRSGEWLAWEGSGDWAGTELGGAIDGVVTPRSPGSTLKPFAYALAFEAGATPATVVPDLPASFPTARSGVAWSPRNYDGRFRGPLRAREALAGSINVAAAALLERVGPESLLGILRKGGMTTFAKSASWYGLGLVLGDAEVRLDQLVPLYAAIARGGLGVAPARIRRIDWPDGRSERSSPPATERLFSERASFWVAGILADPEARAFVFGRGGSLDFPFPVAAKTGTSQAYRDNWTIGFTREVTVGVWVGNFDRQPLRSSSGVVGAAPIFHEVLLAAEQRVLGRWPGAFDPPIVDPPDGLGRRPICLLSGLSPNPACPAVAEEWLPSDEIPRRCDWHRRVGNSTVVEWPAEYRSWARSEGRENRVAARTTTSFPPSDGNGPSDSGGSPLRPEAVPARTDAPLIAITNPPAGAVYLYDPTLRAEFQALPLRVTARGAVRSIRWSVDGKAIGEAPSDAPFDWPLAAGRHRIAATDPLGHRAEVEVNVR
jgi:penicillin-binding protein 1C